MGELATQSELEAMKYLLILVTIVQTSGFLPVAPRTRAFVLPQPPIHRVQFPSRRLPQEMTTSGLKAEGDEEVEALLAKAAELRAEGEIHTC